MKVLSLFDGMSCGQIALERAGIPVETYYASEVDKHAIAVTQANYPNTVQLGDVEAWRDWDIDWSSIGLLLAGSPCQGFSFAGGGLAFDHPESRLFFVFNDIRNHLLLHNPCARFLLENVYMRREHEQVITGLLGVEPVKANSDLVSAQNRKRNYWFNWDALPPADRGITWGDIRERNAPDVHYYSQKAHEWFKKHEKLRGKGMAVWPDNGKCQMLEASMYKNYSLQRFFGVLDVLGYRYISLLECERAQTVPEGYTNHTSNGQRYRMLGNGWTVDMIAHFLQIGLAMSDKSP